MLRVEQAFDFIEYQGSDLDRYRSDFLFKNRRDDTMAAWLLGAYQNADGGYPLQLEYGEPSNISETAKVIGYAAEMEIFRAPVTHRALEFIYSSQHPHGFWQESCSQLELGDELGGEWGRMWLSAYVGRQLCRIQHKDSHQTKLLRNYLLSLRVNGNRFSASPAIHFLALSFFALLDGPACGIVKEGLGYAMENFTTYAEPRLISIQAECLMDAGLPAEHEILADVKKRLVDLQKPDGSWGEQDKKERVRITIDTLKLLLALGAWRMVEE